MLKYAICLFLVIGMPAAAATFAPGHAYHDVSGDRHASRPAGTAPRVQTFRE
jgi:hypothetical protein